MRWFCFVCVAALTLNSVGAQASADERSAALRERATREVFSLEAERAIATYREAIAADPQDAAAYRGMAGAVLAQIGMLRGTMTVDSYLGRVSRGDVPMPPPPPELAKNFHDAVNRAVALGRERVAARPRDPQAHYELGAAEGIRASYLATVDGGVMSALGAARDAFNSHEKVLALDARRADAGLIVGTYRYLVAALALPARLVAYMVGFGGGRDRGIRMVEGAAGHPGDNQSDASLALVLLYTRERRYDDALRQLSVLRARYPSNRLLLLEAGSTHLRANRPADAERVLDEGIRSLDSDRRKRMFGEDALWFYRRGSARAALGRTAEARTDLDRSIASEGRPWVHGRAHLELGTLSLRARDYGSARQHLSTAARLGDSDRDGESADRARELLKKIPSNR